jgi:hypothetical protein
MSDHSTPDTPDLDGATDERDPLVPERRVNDRRGRGRRGGRRAEDHAPFRLDRRNRVTAGLLVLLLGLVVALIWGTPQGQRVFHGPTTTEVALQTQTARADDLKAQLAALQGQLSSAQSASAKLLAQQPESNDRAQLTSDLAAQQARADDLAKQVEELTAALQAPKPATPDKAALARAADLKRQVDLLSDKVAHPKGYTPPPVVPTMTKAQILQANHLFGLYTMQSPFSYGEFDGVQTAVNRNADVSGYFQSWDTDFRPDAVQAAWSRGQIPLLTWESQSQVGVVSAIAPEYSLKTIINGSHDDYIRKYAHDIAANGMPLVLRFDHEMNGTWYPWSEVRGWDGASVNGNSVGDYPKMWRHVHDIFQQEGANDYVIWLWSPNRVNKIPSQRPPAAFYPGDGYVDWIGMSGYYRPGDPAPTFANSYGQTLPLLRATTDKPIFLSEIGATETTGHKSEWINDFFTALQKPQNSDIIGFGWFSLTVTGAANEDGTRTTNDWRITSSGSAIRAFAAGLAAAGFGKPLTG